MEPQSAATSPVGAGGSEEDGPLDDAAFERASRFTREQQRVLDGIAAGNVGRNSATIVAALKLKAEYGYKKRAPAGDGSTGPLTIIVQTVIPQRTEAVAPQHLALSPPVAEPSTE